MGTRLALVGSLSEIPHPEGKTPWRSHRGSLRASPNLVWASCAHLQRRAPAMLLWGNFRPPRTQKSTLLFMAIKDVM